MYLFLISIFIKIFFFLYLFLVIYIFFFVKKINFKKKIIYFFFFHFLSLNLFLITIYFSIRKEINSIKSGNFYNVSNTSWIYNNESNELIGQIGFIKREYIKIENINEKILKTIITVEDEKFFNNYGISFHNLCWNLFKAIFTNKKFVGASTITQQLARNLFLNRKISFWRKIKEIALSFYLNYYCSKNYILEMYINYIFLGNNIYGLKMAADYYFNKNLNDLEIEEIAYLIGIIKGPSLYLNNFFLAMERRNYILSRMKKNKIIEDDEIYKNKPIKIEKKKNKNNENYYYIIEEIKEDLKKLNLDLNDGYRIYITIDNDLQNYSTEVLKNNLEKAEENILWLGPISRNKKDFSKIYENSKLEINKKNLVILKENGEFYNSYLKGKINEEDLKKYASLITDECIVFVEKKKDEWFLTNGIILDGAIIIVDPQNGKILTEVGGRGINYSYMDGVNKVEKSPGSIAKIFPYLYAFEKGLLPSDKVNDNPIYVDIYGNIYEYKLEEKDQILNNSSLKIINNHDKKYQGEISVRCSFEKSRNVPIIHLSHKFGIRNIKNFFIDLDIINEFSDFYLSGVLGSIYITIKKMIKALSIIPNGGYKLDKVYFIERITDLEGKEIYKNEIKKEKFLSDKSIFFMESLCEGVIQRWLNNKMDPKIYPLAGKTGTSQKNREASFVVWCKNYIIYILIYNRHNIPYFYKLWGREIPVKIAKNILDFLKNKLEYISIENLKPNENFKKKISYYDSNNNLEEYIEEEE